MRRNTEPASSSDRSWGDGWPLSVGLPGITVRMIPWLFRAQLAWATQPTGTVGSGIQRFDSQLDSGYGLRGFDSEVALFGATSSCRSTSISPVRINHGSCLQPLEKPMKNVLKYSFLVSGVVLFLSVNAYAAAIVLQAPEIDLSLAIGGFSFLVGTLVVLRSRLRK